VIFLSENTAISEEEFIAAAKEGSTATIATKSLGVLSGYNWDAVYKQCLSACYSGRMKSVNEKDIIINIAKIKLFTPKAIYLDGVEKEIELTDELHESIRGCLRAANSRSKKVPGA
jgi:hypothetical protein